MIISDNTAWPSEPRERFPYQLSDRNHPTPQHQQIAVRVHALIVRRVHAPAFGQVRQRRKRRQSFTSPRHRVIAGDCSESITPGQVDAPDSRAARLRKYVGLAPLPSAASISTVISWSTAPMLQRSARNAGSSDRSAAASAASRW